MLLRTKDHPEANDRRPLHGEEQWIVTIPLEDGTTLTLKMGKKSRDTIYGMMIAEDTEDARQS